MHHINQLEPPSSAEAMTRQGRKNIHQNRENERERRVLIYKSSRKLKRRSYKPWTGSQSLALGNPLLLLPAPKVKGRWEKKRGRPLKGVWMRTVITAKGEARRNRKSFKCSLKAIKIFLCDIYFVSRVGHWVDLWNGFYFLTRVV